jgi:hypothetical protein
MLSHVLAFILFATTTAYAQTALPSGSDLATDSELKNTYTMPLAAVKVEQNYLKLLGRGIENKTTHEVVSLACVDDCKTIRAIYLDPNTQESWFFGYIYEGTENPSEEKMSQITKGLKKSFRQFKREDSVSYHYGRMQGSMALVTLGVVGLFYAATTNLNYLYAAFATFIGGGAVIVWKPGVFKYEPVTASLNDQSNWNWSSNPKKMSASKFDLVMKYLTRSGNALPPNPVSPFRIRYETYMGK